MNITDKEIDHIATLLKSEKPYKYVREYIQNLSHNESRIERNLKFFNKMYKAFFSYYFATFAGVYKTDCVMEAYATALSRIKGGAELDIAIEDGLKSGNKLFRQHRGEQTLGDYDEYK